MAKAYGSPRHDIVIEPFAGSAGYSCYWNADKVILVEKDPEIAELWQYLIAAEYDDIMALPIVYHVDDFPKSLSMAEQHLIQSWWGRNDPHWRNYITEKNRNTDYKIRFWGEECRQDIANHVHLVNDWEIIEGDYWDAPDIEAHWHIDPPYQHQGKLYRYNGDNIDFNALGEWCMSRKGSGEVCEASPADWLPFEPFRLQNNQKGRRYQELVYRFGNDVNTGLFE